MEEVAIRPKGFESRRRKIIFVAPPIIGGVPYASTQQSELSKERRKSR